MNANTTLLEKSMDGTYEYELEGTYTISDSHSEILYKMALFDCYRDQGRYLSIFQPKASLYCAV